MRPGILIDWLWGGLNYQIEHHLFPSMPRHNLKTVIFLLLSFEYFWWIILLKIFQLKDEEERKKKQKIAVNFSGDAISEGVLHGE